MALFSLPRCRQPSSRLQVVEAWRVIAIEHMLRGRHKSSLGIQHKESFGYVCWRMLRPDNVHTFRISILCTVQSACKVCAWMQRLASTQIQVKLKVPVMPFSTLYVATAIRPRACQPRQRNLQRPQARSWAVYICASKTLGLPLHLCPQQGSWLLRIQCGTCIKNIMFMNSFLEYAALLHLF